MTQTHSGYTGSMSSSGSVRQRQSNEITGEILSVRLVNGKMIVITRDAINASNAFGSLPDVVLRRTYAAMPDGSIGLESTMRANHVPAVDERWTFDDGESV
jgi:hypothetical protein